MAQIGKKYKAVLARQRKSFLKDKVTHFDGGIPSKAKIFLVQNPGCISARQEVVYGTEKSH